MKISRSASRKLRQIDSCQSNDLRTLIITAGEHFETFFDGGLWENLDFSPYDMRHVTFYRATVIGCTFREGDISDDTVFNCHVFKRNKFIPIDQITYNERNRQNDNKTRRKNHAAHDVDDENRHSPIDSNGSKEYPDNSNISFGDWKPNEDTVTDESTYYSEGDSVSFDHLLGLIKKYNKKTDANLIHTAYSYAAQIHEGQKLQSGYTYFSHPLGVAKIIINQELDDVTIASALLHDAISETTVTYENISQRLGSEIAGLVHEVTKLTSLVPKNYDKTQADYYQQLFLAISKDLRAILVKFADRLHVMRTLRNAPKDMQINNANEAIDIYAPLAGRMGMYKVREELEDLAFKVLNPEARATIIRRFTSLHKAYGDITNIMPAVIRRELEDNGIKAEVLGRTKKPYSIWRSMHDNNLTFSKVLDTYTFYISTETESQCYRAQGIIHKRWRAVPGNFYDYISHPRKDGHRSIRTVVLVDGNIPIELVIRTRNASISKSLPSSISLTSDLTRLNDPIISDREGWIEILSSKLNGEVTADEILDAVKVEMYPDQVFCFTPKGNVVRLPKGASPLDFGYAIHTDVGNTCVGAKVDGVRVPLWTRLKNGQTVEIIRSEKQTPQHTWLSIAVTGKAKSAIRRALQETDQLRYIRLGRELIRSAFEHVGKKASDKAIEKAAQTLRLPGGDALLARLGAAELSARAVIRAVYPDIAPSYSVNAHESGAVLGLEQSQDFTRATCCQPLPGERIVGIKNGKCSVTLHAIDCANLAEYDHQPELWLDLHWASGSHPPVYTVTFDVTIGQNASALGRIFTLIGELEANISDVRFIGRKPDFYRLLVDIDLSDVKQLHTVISAIDADSDVACLERQRGSASSCKLDMDQH